MSGRHSAKEPLEDVPPGTGPVQWVPEVTDGPPPSGDGPAQLVEEI
jgi:hypothetical protein